MPKKTATAFADIVNQIEEAVGETNLAGTHPGSDKSSYTGGLDTEHFSYKCSYRKYYIGEGEEAELEKIMDDCLSGKLLLITERFTDTKDGRTYAVIKFLTPTAK